MKNEMKKWSMSAVVLAFIVALLSFAFAQEMTQTMTDARVNVNTATAEELQAIPGVGEKVAAEILEYRPYTSLEQFRAELGKYMDAEALSALESHITLGLANLNTATREELMALPGIGEKIADEIFEYRPFTSEAHVRAELGKYLDEAAINDILAMTTIGTVDVNTATREELMAIPGVGEKIADEILEYRPYTSIEQFRAELGKYLDAEAVHTIELYVMLGSGQ